MSLIVSVFCLPSRATVSAILEPGAPSSNCRSSWSGSIRPIGVPSIAVTGWRGGPSGGLALLAAVVSQLLPLISTPPLASGALTSLMLPLGVLLCVEAMRGAPTVRRWLH